MFKRILSTVALLLVSSAVFADTIQPGDGDTWEFYAYGNSHAIAQIFIGLSMIVKTDAFYTLCSLIAIGGFAASGFSGVFSGNIAKTGGYFIGVCVLVYALFALKVDIWIKEMVHTPGAANTGVLVRDVPAAVGLPMVVISEIGTTLTEMMTTYMTSPDPTTQRPPGGMPFAAGLSLANDLTKVRIANPYLQKNFNDWVNTCFVPRAVTGQINLSAMVSSPDIWHFMGNTLAGRSESQFVKTTFLNGSVTNKSADDDVSDDLANAITEYRGILSCRESYEVITEQLSREVSAGMGDLARKVAPQLLASGVLSSDAIKIVAQHAAGSSLGDATTLATQGAIIDLMNKSTQYQAIALGNNAAMMALNSNNALRAQKTGWYTASVLFRDMGGYFYAILQAFLIGITPIIAALMFIPGMGAKLGGSYIKACIWLASWWPSLQVVNYIMELYFQSQTGNTMGPAGGMTMANTGIVNQLNDNMVIAAGFMATLVPTVMWGIINGTGMALTSVLDRASGASYASAAAQDAAAGNFRTSNIGMNSMSANKFDTSVTHATGAHATEAAFGGGAHQVNNQLGGVGTSMNGAAAVFQHSMDAINKTATAMSDLKSSSLAFSNAASTASQQSIADMQSVMSGTQTSEDGSRTFGTAKEFQTALNSAGNFVETYNQLLANGMTKEAKAMWEAGVSGSGGLGKDGFFGVSIGAGISGSTGSSEAFTISKTESGALQITDSQGHAIKSTDGTTFGVKSSAGDQTSDSLAYAKNTTTTDLASRSEDYTEAYAKVQSALSEQSASTKIAANAGFDLNTVDYLNQSHARNAAEAAKYLDNPGVSDAARFKAEAAIGAGNQTISDGKQLVDSDFQFISKQANHNLNENSDGAKGGYNASKAQFDSSMLKTIDDKNEAVLARYAELSKATPGITSIVPGSEYDKQRAEAMAELRNMSGIQIGGQVYQPSGVHGTGDNAELIYRTGNNLNDAAYYTIQDGKLTPLAVDDINNKNSISSSEANNLGGTAASIGGRNEMLSPSGNDYVSIGLDPRVAHSTGTGIDRAEAARQFIQQNGMDAFDSRISEIQGNTSAYRNELQTAAQGGDPMANIQYTYGGSIGQGEQHNYNLNASGSGDNLNVTWSADKKGEDPTTFASSFNVDKYKDMND